MKKAIAIITADLHLRDTVPVCRIDNYLEAQNKKLAFIKDLVLKNNCPLIVAGDVFHKAKSSPYVEKIALEFFKDINCIVIPGQHDLLYHKLSFLNQSSYGVLFILNNKDKIKFYSVEFEDWLSITIENKKFAIGHMFMSKPNDKQDFIIAGKDYNDYFKKLRSLHVDVIITGDNHKPFIVENDYYIHINPGSMMRMTANQIDYNPMVLVLFSDLSYETIYLPIEEGVVDRLYLDEVKKKDDKIEAFVNRVSMDYDLDIDFLNNLRMFLNNNKIRKGVVEEINNVLSEVI